MTFLRQSYQKPAPVFYHTPYHGYPAAADMININESVRNVPLMTSIGTDKLFCPNVKNIFPFVHAAVASCQLPAGKGILSEFAIVFGFH